MRTDQSLKGSSRLSSVERREAIVEAVKGVFAEKGFDGATTRELARAAEVSEALLYRHFPSKKSLYAAMTEAYAQDPIWREYHRILELEPSTSTLVKMVHFLIAQAVEGGSEQVEALGRMAARSLLEDGEFVRVAFREFNETWAAKFEACLRAADAAGELAETGRHQDLRARFVHHMALALMLYSNPSVSAINYRASRKTLVEQAVRFALLGAGLKGEAIRRHYQSKAPRQHEAAIFLGSQVSE
jgi:AcrR family transcriptional regulator